MAALELLPVQKIVSVINRFQLASNLERSTIRGMKVSGGFDAAVRGIPVQAGVSAVEDVPVVDGYT